MAEEEKKKGDKGPNVYSINEDAELESKKMFVKVLSNYLPKDEIIN